MSEETLFHEALARSPAERAAFLEQACAGQPELRAAVEALLAAHEQLGGLLDRAPITLSQVVDSDSTRLEAASSPFNLTADYHLALEAGVVIAGRYTLEKRIGEGGMGAVWVARQTEPVKRKVALKLIRPGIDSRAVLQRFEQERQALAVMDHPNIARVLDGGLTPDRRPFFVMDLVHGLPLTHFCDEARLTIRARLELFVPICQAVQHAHQKGIVHRDLKPANILVTLIDGKPVPRVIDFGVAKATAGRLTDESLSTQFGTIIGTLEYMAPEQASLSGADIDTRADIYSLGVILYELLTGLRPLDGTRLKKAALTEMMRILKEEEPSKPSTRLSTDEAAPSLAALRQTEPRKLRALLRGELDWVVMKCLEKQRDRRYETANGLARDIQRYLADEAVEARPPSAGYRLGKFLRRNKGPVVAASLVLLALVAGIIGTSWGLFQAKQQAQMARSEATEKEEARQAEARQRVVAEELKEKAVRATEAEKAANAQAQKRLKQIEKVNEILASIFENLDPREIARAEKPLQAILVDNLDRAVEQLEGEAIGDALVVAAMQNRLGYSLLCLGEPIKAIVLLERARDTFKARLGPDHLDTLVSTNNLAAAYQDAGKWDRALPLYEETFKRTKARLGPDHPDTLISMNNLAAAYQDAGKRERAVSLFEEAHERTKARLGRNHPETLLRMSNLAEAYQMAGKWDRALPLYEETLGLRKVVLGSDHPQTLISMNNLAGAYRAAGKLDRALPLLEETLQRRKARLGPDHPDTLDSMSNLAEVYQDNGKLPLALPLLEETLKLRKARLGPDHPNTLLSMNNLAGAYQAAGKRDRALPLFEETLQLCKVRLGSRHPQTLLSMNNLALAYQDAGKLDLALSLFEETLKLRKVRLGPDHPDTLVSMSNLARMHQSVGKWDLALPLYEETLKLMQARLGPGHPHTLTIMGNLGKSLCRTGQGEKAATLFKKLVSSVRKQFPPNSPGFAGLLAQVARELIGAGQYSTAEQMLREGLAICEKKIPEVWLTFSMQSMLGGALLGQKKYVEAEPLLRAGYDGMKQREKTIPHRGKVHLLEAVERLVQLYEATGKKDEAARWRKELETAQTARRKQEKQPRTKSP